MTNNTIKSLETLSSNEFKTGLVAQQLTKIISGIKGIEYANESVRAINYIFKVKYNISLNLALTSNGKFASKNFSKHYLQTSSNFALNTDLLVFLILTSRPLRLVSNLIIFSQS